MRNLLIGIVVVVVVAVLGYFLLKGSYKNSSNNTTTNSSSQQSNNSSTVQSQGNTITYTSGSFSPATLTVKSGDTVTLINKSNDTIQFDSNPHPVHTDNTELNVGAVGPGETKTFTLTKKGTWGYHNHLESSERGTIVVE